MHRFVKKRLFPLPCVEDLNGRFPPKQGELAGINNIPERKVHIPGLYPGVSHLLDIPDISGYFRVAEQESRLSEDLRIK